MKSKFFLYIPLPSSPLSSVRWFEEFWLVQVLQVMEFPPVRGEFIIKTRSINMKTSIWVWDRSTI